MGTLLNTADSFDGYTLFAPVSSTRTYLIDNCGQVVNEWQSNDRPALSAYLLEDGSLLRTQQANNAGFNSGGSGGKIQRFSWDGTLVWDFDLSNQNECQHHDVEYLPNGNILMIAWEKRTSAEAIAAGRNTDFVPPTLWPEKIVEIAPTGLTTGDVVWEWRAWDHLIQDFDPAKANYGVVADHPELIDINYPESATSDWLHANSIDHNAELDQIVISLRSIDEIWVIDHSTTTAEAASHTGGNSGKGGDLLYRWGNPQTYGRGDDQARVFYGQHDARWITDGPDAGKLMIFNNGQNRPSGLSYSSVDVIAPPVDAFGQYTAPVAGEPFLPAGLDWTYEGTPNTSFFAVRVSGAERLPNNNTLICNGPAGRFFEINDQKEVVWEYQSPIAAALPVEQGTPAGTGHNVFRCTRYAPDFAAFEGRDLTPGDVIELNSTATCELFTTPTSIADPDANAVQLVSDHGNNTISIRNIRERCHVEVFDLFGRVVAQTVASTDVHTLSTAGWPAGIYLFRVGNADRVTSKKAFVN